MKSYYSHGKLLLTGEYVVLDGALSLAIPTKFGQDLKVEKNANRKLHWKSIDQKSQVWFEDTFIIQNNEILKQVQNNDSISKRLLQVLNAAKKLNPDFLTDEKGYKISTQLEFPKNWGLGTSSTLINNISNWANINPYDLLQQTFGGSGYDIACADANKSLTFQLNKADISHSARNDNEQLVKSVDFNPSFKEYLFFVHLNQKQNSREGIAQYRANTSDLKQGIESINHITQHIIDCDSLEHFQQLIDQHEHIISKMIKHEPVKKRLFNDFNGSIKSLGAWGGDFVLVASKDNPTTYFENKGFSTILEYSKMSL